MAVSIEDVCLLCDSSLSKKLENSAVVSEKLCTSNPGGQAGDLSDQKVLGVNSDNPADKLEPTAERDAATEDLRTCWIATGETGPRSKTWRDVVQESTQETFSDSVGTGRGCRRWVWVWRERVTTHPPKTQTSKKEKKRKKTTDPRGEGRGRGECKTLLWQELLSWPGATGDAIVRKSSQSRGGRAWTLASESGNARNWRQPLGGRRGCCSFGRRPFWRCR